MLGTQSIYLARLPRQSGPGGNLWREVKMARIEWFIYKVIKRFFDE